MTIFSQFLGRNTKKQTSKHTFKQTPKNTHQNTYKNTNRHKHKQANTNIKTQTNTGTNIKTHTVKHLQTRTANRTSNPPCEVHSQGPGRRAQLGEGARGTCRLARLDADEQRPPRHREGLSRGRGRLFACVKTLETHLSEDT